MRRATVGGLVLLCALVTVCPADGDRSAAPGDGDLRALLQPSRPFETRGALRVDVSNLGDEDVRIAVCVATQRVLAQTLGLLGVEAPESM